MVDVTRLRALLDRDDQLRADPERLPGAKYLACRHVARLVRMIQFGAGGGWGRTLRVLALLCPVLATLIVLAWVGRH